MKFIFNGEVTNQKGALIIGSFIDNKLTADALEINHSMGGALMRAIESSRFKGKVGEALAFLAPSPLTYTHVIVVGLGDPTKQSEKNLEDIGGHIYAELKNYGVEEATLRLKAIEFSDFSSEESIARITYGLLLRAWHFDKYYTVAAKKPKHPLETVTLISDAPQKTEASFRVLEKIAAGVFITRTLVSEPPNVIYPVSMAQAIKQDLTPLGVTVEILGRDALEKLGMGALLGVGQGSIREQQLVVMQWQGANADEQPVAFVGKGVTFDTGGISIKPAGGMEDMKYDMAGAAAVVGTLKALAGRKAKVNAVGVVGLVENMPSGSAIRPSDILTSLSGQTIEVLNTDAEGRLVLCDALWYTQDRFKPKFMINLATLTGAIVISLGDQFAGLFSNDDSLSTQLLKTGERTGERLWRFPLDEAYDREIDSTIADMKNISNGRKAGSITAAQFLQRFVNKTPWAHLDIAGMAWADKSLPTVEKGATGYGVRLLNALVEEFYETK